MSRLYFIAVLSVVSILLVGCYKTYVAKYDIGMTEVERPADMRERYGDAVITRSDSVGVSRYLYEDSLMSIVWIPGAEVFSFALTNKTEHTMKIIWDEAAFVDPNGQSQRVMHTGVKYADRNAAQPPTVVVRGGLITDIVVPTNNVYYVSGRYGGWRTEAIFQPHSGLDVKALEPAKQNIGKSVQILLPLSIEGHINEYMFTFRVDNVSLPN